MLNKTRNSTSILAKYETDVFSDVGVYIKEKLKARGVHDVILHEFRSCLEGKNILDVGCGLGRFSFISSPIAKFVVGVDFVASAISEAKCLRRALSINNIDFVCSDIQSFDSDVKFDVIVLSGTLEHLPEPQIFFDLIDRVGSDNCVLLSDSPSEFNFRGAIHGGLWKAFDWPMTKTDVRIVEPRWMDVLAEANSFKPFRKPIGTLYSRAFGPMGHEDLIGRLPKVLADVSIDLESYCASDFDAWTGGLFSVGSRLLDYFASVGKLKLVSSVVERKNPIDVMRLVDEFGFEEARAQKLYHYMDPKFDDPYYSTDELVALLGGNVIYSYKRDAI